MTSKESLHTPESNPDHQSSIQRSTSLNLYSILNGKINIKNRPILILIKLIILKTSIISKIGKQKTRDVADTNEKCENKEFSLNHLDNILETSTEDEGLLYLQNSLKEIGSGFSRRVFPYLDNLVIKYDCNPKDYTPSQNTVELDYFTKLNSPILPNIYFYGKDNIYLVCEQVRQIQPGDFQKILHIPFGDDKIDTIGNIGTFKSIYCNCLTVKKFIYIMEKIYFSPKPKNDIRSFFNYLPSDTADLNRIREKEETLKNVSKTEKELYKGLANHHPRFKELARYIEYVISTYDTDYCDLGIKSFGVVIRDGKPYICILDTGRSGKI